ncbi:MAG: helix-turn-helix domain-containing protein [Cytophagaceae bacterium]|nr:helix-turn-helix domain-containing protein [Cytophagaceae bacterium]
MCRNPRQRFDGTVLAQKALSGIARTRESVAMGALIDILRGSRNQNVLRHGYEQLPTFGTGHDLKGEEWAEYLSQLLNSGVMDIAYDEGHSFKLNATSWQVLKESRKVELVKFVSFEERKVARETAEPTEKPKREVIKDAMFDRLRTLRKAIADTQGVPPYVIFSDATLSEMAQKRPITEGQMKGISGVGAEKFRRFGEAFINEILGFARETAASQPNKLTKLQREISVKLTRLQMQQTRLSKHLNSPKTPLAVQAELPRYLESLKQVENTLIELQSTLQRLQAQPDEKQQQCISDLERELRGINTELGTAGDVALETLDEHSEDVSGRRVIKESTYAQTLELYQAGHSIEEMAAQRNLNPMTIASHLLKLKEEGYAINLRSFVSDAVFEEISAAARALNLKRGDAMKPLFEHFQQRYEYDVLRLVVWEMD